MGDHVHHATDRSMKIKGVGNIGHLFLYPYFTDAEHTAIHNAGHNRKILEKAKFQVVCYEYLKTHDELPFSDEVGQAILAFHK